MNYTCTLCKGNGFVKMQTGETTFEDRGCPLCLGTKVIEPEFLLNCKCGRGGWFKDSTLPEDSYPKVICDYCKQIKTYEQQQTQGDIKREEGSEGSQPATDTNVGSKVE